MIVDQKNYQIQKRAVILVSGGMDSIVAGAMIMEQYHTAFLHIDYGQRTEHKERQCFLDLVKYYRPFAYKLFDFKWLGELKGSSLTDLSLSVPEYTQSAETVPNTYVPFRNTILLAAAISWAEVLGASRVVYGAVESDRAGYPDCRQSYIDSYNQLISRGSAAKQIEIVAPLIQRTKPEIVTIGQQLGVPFHLTWSCYQNSDEACGVCESCLLRRSAFKITGIQDPIPYAR